MNQDGRAQKANTETPSFASRNGMTCNMASGIRSLRFRDRTGIPLKLRGGFQAVLDRPLEIEGSGHRGKRVGILFPKENRRQQASGQTDDPSRGHERPIHGLQGFRGNEPQGGQSQEQSQ